MFVCFFFFFQAEDGIRDHCVTGVQTCALPILLGEPDTARCNRERRAEGELPDEEKRHQAAQLSHAVNLCKVTIRTARTRSEERRVGKECRSRWSRYQ